MEDGDGGRVVTVSVGGVKYTATKGTLCKSAFFAALLSEKLPSVRDSKGRFFVERCGAIFGPLLEFLRTGELSVPESIAAATIQREAEFYGIDLPAQFRDTVERSATANSVSAVTAMPNTATTSTSAAMAQNVGFVTDDWLMARYLICQYEACRPLIERLIGAIVERFRWCSEHSLWPPEATFRGPLDENALTATLDTNMVRRDGTVRREIIAVVRLKYEERSADALVCTDLQLFQCLQQHRSLVQAYCRHHGLTADVLDGHGIGHNTLAFDITTLMVGFPPQEFREAVISHSRPSSTHTRTAWPELVVRGAVGNGAFS